MDHKTKPDLGLSKLGQALASSPGREEIDDPENWEDELAAEHRRLIKQVGATLDERRVDATDILDTLPMIETSTAHRPYHLDKGKRDALLDEIWEAAKRAQGSIVEDFMRQALSELPVNANRSDQIKARAAKMEAQARAMGLSPDDLEREAELAWDMDDELDPFENAVAEGEAAEKGAANRNRSHLLLMKQRLLQALMDQNPNPSREAAKAFVNLSEMDDDEACTVMASFLDALER